MAFDPLSGLEARPMETQVAVLVAESRSQRNSMTGLRADVTQLRAEVAGLRRALIGFAMTVAASSVLFAGTIFVVFR